MWACGCSLPCTSLSGLGTLLPRLLALFWSCLTPIVRYLTAVSAVDVTGPVPVAVFPQAGPSCLAALGASVCVIDQTTDAARDSDAAMLAASGEFRALVQCVQWAVSMHWTTAELDVAPDRRHRARLASPIDAAHGPLVRNAALAVFNGVLVQLAFCAGTHVLSPYVQPIGDPKSSGDAMPVPPAVAATEACSSPASVAAAACVDVAGALLRWCLPFFQLAEGGKDDPSPTDCVNDIRLHVPPRNRISVAIANSQSPVSDVQLQLVLSYMRSCSPVMESVAYGLLSALYTVAHSVAVQKCLATSPWAVILTSLLVSPGVSMRVQVRQCFRARPCLFVRGCYCVPPPAASNRPHPPPSAPVQRPQRPVSLHPGLAAVVNAVSCGACARSGARGV